MADGVYNDNIHVLKKVMGRMLNNKTYSDAVFTVKDQQFYVLSQLLAASSTTLDNMMSTHYEHCHDRDLTIYRVKHEDSFLLILKYIYGQSLDFHTTPVHVLCEVLSLAERYQLSEFFDDLKRFLSKLNYFELESAVVLLNTASKYNLSELYEQLTVFAYQHAEQLVKHDTFPDLDYNVLTHLVQSDWFACSEIDILTGVLTWHSGMDRERKNWKTRTSQDDIVMEHDYTSKTKPTLLDGEEQDGEHIDHLDFNKDTCTSTDNSEQLIEMRDTCPEVMRLFSENILKSLLARIRFPRMFASDLLRTLKSELGKNYIDLLDETYFSQSSEPRRKYQAQSSEATSAQHRMINNVTKTFQILSSYCHTMYESEEEYLLGDLKWKICLKWTVDPTRIKTIYTMYFECICDNNQKDWECTVECQLKWISHNTSQFKTLVLPHDNSYSALTFTRDNSCVEMGKWERIWMDNWGSFDEDWSNAFIPGSKRTFELVFKSLNMKNSTTLI
uniref:BTB/POZ domain-containing protein 9 n=1 Tax=Cacopsylla melanoneura TaxID=428564 RepID=A0A8D8RB65_9HEMI